jgi:hypothetical protein
LTHNQEVPGSSPGDPIWRDMHPYRIMYCLDTNTIRKNPYSFGSVDMGKETFMCPLCNQEHSVAESLKVVDENKYKFTSNKN